MPQTPFCVNAGKRARKRAKIKRHTYTQFEYALGVSREIISSIIYKHYMSSKLFRVNVNDLLKGIVVAVLTAVVAYLGDVLSIPGFDLLTLDWGMLLNISLTAGLGYILKNFMTDEVGRFGGVL